MFRSLRTRLVLFMTLLIVLMMAAVGVFLARSVSSYQLDAFARQMSDAFSNRRDFVDDLRAAADAENPPAALKEILRAYSGLLGVDMAQRNYYILDARTGAFLAGSDDVKGKALTLTPAILTALGGADGAGEPKPDFSRRVGDPYMDAAVPIKGNGDTYIIYIRDTKESLQTLISQLFVIILEALAVGVALALLLSLVLSKAITNPLERLTHSALRLAEGHFDEGLAVQSGDEIGVLTRTFNDMAQELRRTLEEVGAERDKLGTLFLHMTDGVASFGRDGAPIQANPAAERLLGRPFEQIVSYGEVLGAVAPLTDVLALKEPRYLQKDWETGGRSLLVSLAPFGGTPAEGVMAVLHDVTRQRRLDDLRREFVSNVSHELRTPLTNIRSYAETLHDAEDLPPEQARSFSQVILNEAERMNRIVRDLLTLSRFDYGKMDWHVTTFPLAAMLGSIYEAMLLEARRQGHTLTLYTGETPIVLSGDRERLEQVVANILSNAIKYTPSGGQIALAARQEGDIAVVTVTDTGIGIPEEDMPRLFERFYRVDKARSRRLGGTGLGLAIAREIVEGHRGDIKIESRLGHGTVVTVTLPLGDAP
ncbi:MAG: cell wall metabolism sensor histidine kinase WalK [Oscillospiraceae bacterium]|jgi:two-component system sensor histidine kinase VicK|nr:cell wall metabolism sensor histidine kinase WalK [Oscillospiraceae bacterium]